MSAEDYDLEQLTAFANRYRFSDDPELCAAAWAITHVLRGDRDVRADVGLARRRGQRGKTVEPARIGLDHPVFLICMARASGVRSYDETLAQIEETLDISRATAARVLRAVLPRARTTYESLAPIVGYQNIADLLS